MAWLSGESISVSSESEAASKQQQSSAGGGLPPHISRRDGGARRGGIGLHGVKRRSVAAAIIGIVMASMAAAIKRNGESGGGISGMAYQQAQQRK